MHVLSWPPTQIRRPLLATALFAAVFANPAQADAEGPPEADPLQPSEFADAGQAASVPEVFFAGAKDAGQAAPDAGALGAGPDAGTDSGPAAATPSQTPDEDKPAFLHATINRIDLGDVFALVRASDFLLRVVDLEKPGLHLEGGAREKRGEDVLVSLRSLAPKIAFVFDEENLALSLTADPSLFGSTAFDLRAKRPDQIIYATAPSLFVNYLVGATDLQSRSQTTGNAYGEAGLSVRGQLLFASVNSQCKYGGTLFDHWNCSGERMMTNLVLDWKSKLTRIVLGDATATSDVLGGGAVMGGLSISRAFALDPYFVFLPTMQLSGTAMTPSTVEVYVNGQLVRRETLAPGQFNLQNVPLTNGSGETRVVVRDAFGGQQTMSSPYYLALGTLAKGLSDFSYNAGFVRQGFGTESWNYGKPAFLVRHRLGVTNWLTVGARAEGTPNMLSAGATLAVRLPWGELGAAAAASVQGQDAGAAALLSYSYVGRPVLVQVGVRYQSDDYANLSLAPANDRQRLDLTATTAMALWKRANASLQFERAVSRDSGWFNRVTLQCNQTITRWMYAFATVNNTYWQSYPVELSTFVGLSFSVAERTTAGGSHLRHWGGQAGTNETTQATVQQSLPVGPGFGYRLTVAQGENDVNDADVQYQGAHGRIEADYQHNGYDESDRGHASLTATGGLVLIGGNAYLTRPVQDSYALIRVPGVPGVHGMLSNQIVGTTDSKGDLLLPSLLSYYGNRVGIDDRDIPLDHDIGNTELTIAPPNRGGAIVTFPVRRVLAAAGTVVVEEAGKAIVPAYGQISVKVGEQQMDSPLDEAGNFYLENVSPGSYSAEVQYATGACTFPLVVPASPTALVQVGTARCIVDRKETE